MVPFFVSRTGKKLRSMNEVHHYLKVRRRPPCSTLAPAPAPRPLAHRRAPRLASQNELGEAGCSEEEALWLRCFERYGRNCGHWAIAQPGCDIPESAPPTPPRAQ